jgi:hypothetical protein
MMLQGRCHRGAVDVALETVADSAVLMRRAGDPMDCQGDTIERKRDRRRARRAPTSILIEGAPA